MQCVNMDLVQPPCSAVYKYALTASKMVSSMRNRTSSLISTYSVTRVVAARGVRRGEHFTRQYSRYRFRNSSACKCSLCCSLCCALTGVCTSALHEQTIVQLLLRSRVAASSCEAVHIRNKTGKGRYERLSELPVHLRGEEAAT